MKKKFKLYNFKLAEFGRTCKWKYISECMHGSHETECGNFAELPMSIKHYMFCPWCGRKIKEI